MSLYVEPLTPTIGARVTGIDLSAPLDETQVGAVRAAWLEHQVLHFPEADLTLDEQKAFAAQFVELFVHPTLKHVDGHHAQRHQRLPRRRPPRLLRHAHRRPPRLIPRRIAAMRTNPKGWL